MVGKEGGLEGLQGSSTMASVGHRVCRSKGTLLLLLLLLLLQLLIKWGFQAWRSDHGHEWS